MKKRLPWTCIGLCLALTVALFSFVYFYNPVKEPTSASDNIASNDMASNNSNKKLINGGGLPPGCKCHSKNPRFVSMHQLFSVQDCQKCHDSDEDLMNQQSSEMTPEQKVVLEKRMSEEPICQECHSDGRIIVSEKTEISGRLFCTEDQKSYQKSKAIKKGEDYYCPKHDVKLIDIDEIAMKSAKEPKNEYCITCHPINKDLQKLHEKVKTAAQNIPLEDCLKCHTSHSQCGGCHF